MKRIKWYPFELTEHYRMNTDEFTKDMYEVWTGDYTLIWFDLSEEEFIRWEMLSDTWYRGNPWTQED